MISVKYNINCNVRLYDGGKNVLNSLKLHSAFVLTPLYKRGVQDYVISLILFL